jgi:hypothetical protein
LFTSLIDDEAAGAGRVRITGARIVPVSFRIGSRLTSDCSQQTQYFGGCRCARWGDIRLKAAFGDGR